MVEKDSLTQIYFADDLISLYSFFNDNIYSPEDVLYPSCGTDGSPSRVFDNVTFVDIDERCIDQMKVLGLNAFNQDIRLYSPKNLHDFLILLNPFIPTSWASNHVSSEGYIFANDYHSNASQMFALPNHFQLVCGLNYDLSSQRVSCVDNLEGFFKEVKDFDELKSISPSKASFIEMAVNNFCDQGLIKVPSSFCFEQKWNVYRESLGERKPFRNGADYYLFQKK